MNIASSTSIYRGLALACMLLIFVLSSQPALPLQNLFSAQDKFEHFLAYAALAYCYARSFVQQGVYTWQKITLITLLTIMYGCSDEFHQSFVPGRDSSLLDVLADGIGGLCMSSILYWYDHLKTKRRELWII